MSTAAGVEPESDEKSQFDRFRDAARELECDDDEARFDAKLKKVAKAPKPKNEKPADPK
jgi:hypothetical protein